MNEKKMSLSTHPEPNPTPQEPWTAVYSNAGCFLHSKENNGMFILLGFFFFGKLLRLYQGDTVNGGDVDELDLHVHQQNCILPH